MNFKLFQRLILASRSPRRLQLLRRVGIEPEVFSELAVTELERAATIEALARENAKRKFLAVANETAWVLAADTVVGLGSDTLGKPKDAAAAKAMLARLSGQTHEVVTAFAIGRAGTREPAVLHAVSSQVTFHELEAAAIADYVATGSPLDKAGAYGLQDGSQDFVAAVEGSRDNVVGLPLREVLEALAALGVGDFLDV